MPNPGALEGLLWGVAVLWWQMMKGLEGVSWGKTVLLWKILGVWEGVLPFCAKSWGA